MVQELLIHNTSLYMILMDRQTGPIVFVYGTLQRGERHHADFFPDSPTVRNARARGTLFQLPAGYPGLLLAETSILATSSGDEEADLALARRWHTDLAALTSSEADGMGWVHGELITVPGYDQLRSLDELEGFLPGRASLYVRVLAPVWPEDETLPIPAWTYVHTEPNGVLLPGGRWPASGRCAGGGGHPVPAICPQYDPAELGDRNDRRCRSRRSDRFALDVRGLRLDGTHRLDTG